MPTTLSKRDPRCSTKNIAKILRIVFFIEHSQWLLLMNQFESLRLFNSKNNIGLVKVLTFVTLISIQLCMNNKIGRIIIIIIFLFNVDIKNKVKNCKRINSKKF